MAVRLIAVDVDGTLLDSRSRLPEANRQAIADAVARGIEVVLVTGRTFHFAQPLGDALPRSVLFIVSNGALVKTPQGDTLLARLLPRQTAREVLAASGAYRECAALVFDRDTERPTIFEHLDWSDPTRRRYYERNRAFLAQQKPLETALTADPVQVMFTGAVAAMRALAVELAALPRAVERFSLARTEYEARDFCLLDVIAPGCSKGSTLAQWVAQRGFARHEVMAVGDNLNDREMLAFAGVPVVMGNAVEALKAQGWPVTGTNDEAGLAMAIRRYAFGD
jgi:Cof subfamily protein (haloacid dehalogenase superfamily)